MLKKVQVKMALIGRVINVVWPKPTVIGLLSHELFSSRSLDNSYCYGIEGALSTYQYAVRTVPLYGPSHLVPVIRHVANFAEVMLTVTTFLFYCCSPLGWWQTWGRLCRPLLGPPTGQSPPLSVWGTIISGTWGSLMETKGMSTLRGVC